MSQILESPKYFSWILPDSFQCGEGPQFVIVMYCLPNSIFLTNANTSCASPMKGKSK